MIEDFARLVPKSLMNRSGSVFYSGRHAFDSPSELYILGLNPGGDIQDQANETVSWHTDRVLETEQHNWSAYRDESWGGTPPGTHRMQRRMLYLFRRLDLNPGNVPASNLIFLRSSREDKLEGDVGDLASRCWLFHQRVIEELGVRVIVCLNGTATNRVCNQVGAHAQVDEYTERNGRRWRSRTFQSAEGVTVVGLTYPGIADWTTPATDPTHLVVRALQGRSD